MMRCRSPGPRADMAAMGDARAASDQSCPISIDLPGTFDGVRWALTQVMVQLGSDRYSLEERGTVELVLAEVLNNVVEHAYAGRSDGKVALRVEQGISGLSVAVEDDGEPMPDGGLPGGAMAAPTEDLLAMPEGGYGWFLIGQLARDHQYRREAGRNSLTFRISVG
ncbi:MAG: ATP-binding protein [Pseudomonadota bacterium]